MKLKEGLVRDQERQQVQHEMKKTMNTYNLQQQKELTKILKRGELASLANETWLAWIIIDSLQIVIIDAAALLKWFSWLVIKLQMKLV